VRSLRPSTALRRDYRREKGGKHGKRLDDLLRAVLDRLVADTPLPPANRDHALTGEWSSYRDCHLKPDLVLIYCDSETLDLVRLGSHSELFG
jgi:mRNA interferase YafQ